jgi:hypothetical protein
MVVGVEREIAPGRRLGCLRDLGQMAPVDDMDALPLAPPVEFPRQRRRIVNLIRDTLWATLAFGIHDLENLPSVMEHKEAMFAWLRGSDVLLRVKELSEAPPGHWIEIAHLPGRVYHMFASQTLIV